MIKFPVQNIPAQCSFRDDEGWVKKKESMFFKIIFYVLIMSTVRAVGSFEALRNKFRSKK